MAMTEDNLDDLVIVRSSLEQGQAQIMQSLLNSHGISAFPNNDNVSSLQYGVKTDLLVRKADFERSDMLLKNIAAIPPKFGMGNGHSAFDVECIHCGSMHVKPFTGAAPTWIPFVKIDAKSEDGWRHCSQCNSYYNEKDKRFRSLPVALSWGLTLAAVTIAIISLIKWLRWSF